MNLTTRTCGMAVVLLAAAACNQDQRQSVDSAAGAVGDFAQAQVSVLDVDVGRHAGADRKITESTDTFAPNDSIFASVHTTGAMQDAALSGRWTFPDGSVITQNADSVRGTDNGYYAFFIAKPEGLAKGQYKFEAIVNGTATRSEDVTVK